MMASLWGWAYKVVDDDVGLPGDDVLLLTLLPLHPALLLGPEGGRKGEWWEEIEGGGVEGVAEVDEARGGGRVAS